MRLTPATTDRDVAQRWFHQFEGAGLDGIVAKPLDGVYWPGKRVMFKVKHERTADCVVAGYRPHASGPGWIGSGRVGSLLLGLYTDEGTLANVGAVGAFPLARREELFAELQPLVVPFDGRPWAWARQQEGTRTPRNAEGSRCSGGKDLSFTPLRPDRVVEVRYEHMEGVRFRHTAQFVRWRPDRDPTSCTYEQLEEPVFVRPGRRSRGQGTRLDLLNVTEAQTRGSRHDRSNLISQPNLDGRLQHNAEVRAHPLSTRPRYWSRSAADVTCVQS